MCGRCGRPRRELRRKEVLEDLPILLEELGKARDLLGKTGGMVSIIEAESGQVFLEPTEFGKIADDKATECMESCQEGAARLREHVLQGDGHRLSWQSRNETEEKWGGAFFDGHYIWSAAGLSEFQNEAWMLMGAQMCGQVTYGTPQDMAKISGNEIILGNPYLFWQPRFYTAEERKWRGLPAE